MALPLLDDGYKLVVENSDGRKFDSYTDTVFSSLS